MTLQEALKNIEMALRSITANADVHDALRQAMEIIKANLKEDKKNAQPDSQTSQQKRS